MSIGASNHLVQLCFDEQSTMWVGGVPLEWPVFAAAAAWQINWLFFLGTFPPFFLASDSELAKTELTKSESSSALPSRATPG